MEVCGECSLLDAWARHRGALEALAERWAGGRVLRWAEACDLVGDAVATACQHCDRVSILPVLQCRAWLFRALRLRVKRARREAAGLQAVLGSELYAPPGVIGRAASRGSAAEDPLAARERRASVERVLEESLSPRERELIRQRFWEDRSVEEIARSEAKSASGIYKALDRLCARLRVPLAGI